MSDLRRNLFSGLGIGLFIATGLTAWATFLRLTGGTAVFDDAGTSYGTTVLLYYLAFPAGGLVLGALLPIRRSAWGAMLLGFLFVLPAYSASIVLQSPRQEWLSSWNVWGALIASAVVGGGLGLWAWSSERKKT